MIPIHFKGSSAQVRPDSGHGDLDGLYVMVKGGMTVSKWRLTMEERLALAKGGVVVLTIIGDQPTVMLTVGDPHG